MAEPWLGCVEVQVMAACKWRVSALPVLMYPFVHCAPVLEIRQFGRYAPIFDSGRPDLNLNTP
jgi:hypothetical protein